MARKPEVKFFTTGSAHAFPLFLYLSRIRLTLNFRMHDLFSLFLYTRRVHVNDLPFGLESQTRLFADNCLIYISITSAADVHKLQSDLKKLELWQSTWQMEFNPEKCFIMCISKQRNPPFREYTFCNTTLAQVEKHPCFGVTLDTNLRVESPSSWIIL